MRNLGIIRQSQLRVLDKLLSRTDLDLGVDERGLLELLAGELEMDLHASQLGLSPRESERETGPKRGRAEPEPKPEPFSKPILETVSSAPPQAEWKIEDPEKINVVPPRRPPQVVAERPKTTVTTPYAAPPPPPPPPRKERPAPPPPSPPPSAPKPTTAKPPASKTVSPAAEQAVQQPLGPEDVVRRFIESWNSRAFGVEYRCLAKNLRYMKPDDYAGHRLNSFKAATREGRKVKQTMDQLLEVRLLGDKAEVSCQKSVQDGMKEQLLLERYQLIRENDEWKISSVSSQPFKFRSQVPKTMQDKPTG